MKAQTTFEYLLLLAGAIVIVVVALTLLGGLLQTQNQTLNNQMNKYLNALNQISP